MDFIVFSAPLTLNMSLPCPLNQYRRHRDFQISFPCLRVSTSPAPGSVYNPRSLTILSLVTGQTFLFTIPNLLDSGPTTSHSALPCLHECFYESLPRAVFIPDYLALWAVPRWSQLPSTMSSPKVTLAADGQPPWPSAFSVSTVVPSQQTPLATGQNSTRWLPDVQSPEQVWHGHVVGSKC